ncbi:MAG: NBR1-Ig-like domain-containing protein [Anaerolineae bacterium]|nr:NBR1-Ig-like domain-containing protein [Anaerolineae bacterium]
MAGIRCFQIISIAAMMALMLACKPIVIVVTPTVPAVIPTPTPTPQPTGVGVVTQTPSPPPASPTATACVMGARLVADVTVPDNTAFAPGTPFIKTWRLHNSGTCAWAPGTKLVFVSGDPMAGPAMVDVPALAPGARSDVSINLVAPTAPGTYRANYQLQAPDGTRFGSIIWVQIVVPGTPTPTPVLICTPPPCPPGGILVCPTPGACPGGCGVVCVTPTPGPCTAVDPALAPVVEVASTFGLNPGCPIGPAFSIYGAFQKFETNPENPSPHARMGAFMIWRSDIRVIYALGLGSEAHLPTHNGRWLGIYQDRWEESQPELHPVCARMSVPSGFQLPIRGFGKVWCENGLWASDRVGWPREREWGVNLLIQPTERGWLIRVRDYPDGYHYLFALDFSAKRWVSTAFRP